MMRIRGEERGEGSKKSKSNKENEEKKNAKKYIEKRLWKRKI